MEGRLVLLMFLSGLWFLPACVPRKYFFVEKSKIWSEAQSYCREKYTDLATIENQEEMDAVVEVAQRYYDHYMWIGLHHEMTPWKWSLEDDGYYAEGGKEFRKWKSGEPDQVNHDCVALGQDGYWIDQLCTSERRFVCSAGEGLAYVPASKSWTDAQSFCRKHYLDLASVRNQAENDRILGLTKGNVWIGLYRGQWKWSDGTPMSFRGWNPEPVGGVNVHCGLLHQDKWTPADCNNLHYFVCYATPEDPVKKQVVKIRVIQKDSSGSLEDAAEAILQEMRQKLKDRGLNEDVKLSWRKQPDGRVFVQEEEEEEEKRKPDEL